MRRGQLWAVTAVVLALLVGLGPLGGAASATPRHQLRGAQLHLLWDTATPAEVDRQLDLLASTGADSGRLDVAWSSLQDQGPDAYASWYVGRLDAAVAGASARGIRLVLTLHETPCWASSAPATLVQGCAGAYWDRGVTHYPPVDPSRYATAAAWVAARYAGRVAALEVWNEPNWRDAGGVTENLRAADVASTYVTLLRPAYAAVKRVAPALPVLAGAMSFSDVPFLQALYAGGARGSYDGVSVHPYNEGRAVGAPHDPAWAAYDFVQGLTRLHAAMLAAGDGAPVWITEVGWTSCGSGGGADPWCVTERQQADDLPGALRTAATWPWVQAVIVYGLRSKAGAPSQTEANFGLVNRDYTPKPALATFTSTVRELAAAESGVPSDAPQPVDPAAVDGAVATPDVVAVVPSAGGRVGRPSGTAPGARRPHSPRRHPVHGRRPHRGHRWATLARDAVATWHRGGRRHDRVGRHVRGPHHAARRGRTPRRATRGGGTATP